MKFIRFFLTALATAAALLILLVAAAFAPPVQTWFARMELLDQPGMQGSLGSLSARFGKLEVEDLKLQFGGRILTLPSMEIRMPLMRAARHRQVLIQSIVAKGWTLDLSATSQAEVDTQGPDAGSGPQATGAAAVAPEKQAAAAFGGVLTGRTLPFDGSLDGVDLDGDVVLAAMPGGAPTRIHVTVTGGGMAEGREGAFSIEASRIADDANPGAPPEAAQCRLVVSMDSPRSFDRVEMRANLSGMAGAQRIDLGVSAAAARSRNAVDESYTVDLTRGDRHVAALSATFPPGSKRLSGTWKVDLRESDLAPFAPGSPLPSVAAAGNGVFDADGASGQLHTQGRVVGVVGRMNVVTPLLARLGVMTVDSQFDVVRTGESIHVNSLSASLAGDRPAAAIKALQPFDINTASREIRVSDPRRDWLDVVLLAFPLARLPVLPGGLTFGMGDVSGKFSVRSVDGGFAMRSRDPLTATSVSLERTGAPVARDLSLSMPLIADVGAKQWRIEASPLTVDLGSRRLATINATGSLPVGANQALAVSGSWKADLETLALMPAFSWITGRSASGDFTGSVGPSSELECKLVVLGHDATHTVSTTLNADEEPSGAGELLAPVKIAFGTDLSDVSVEMSWAAATSEPRTEIKLSSENVALDHLRLLAAPLAAAGGVALAPNSSRSGAGWSRAGSRDAVPFWGDWVGRVSVAFDRLRTGDQDLADVGGSFEVDHGSIELEGGHAELSSKNMANVSGSLLFDPAGERPYALKGTASGLSNLDSALLLPPQPGDDPVIQGHFTVAGTLSGSGINLDDLIAGTQEEFQLAGTNGILRLLRTNIADVIPEAKEPVSDSLGDVGNFVGSILGIKGHSIDPAKNKVGKVPEAVINVTNQVAEIGYDKIAVTAVRGSDRTIRLSHLEMTAPDVHLSGSGVITYVRGLPISAEPFSAELQLGVRDVLAQLVSTAGLLSPTKDSLGFSLLRDPIRFSGTLTHIDASEWHDLLAKAAIQPPPEAPKAAAAH